MTAFAWALNVLLWAGILLLDAVYLIVILPSPTTAQGALVLLIFALAVANLVQLVDTPIEPDKH